MVVSGASAAIVGNAYRLADGMPVSGAAPPASAAETDAPARAAAAPPRGSLVDRFVRGVAGDRARYGWAVALIAAASIVCFPLAGHLAPANLVMVYLLAVAFVAARHGRGPSVLASGLAVAAFDFFFVPPVLTFVVHDTQYLLTFAVMLVIGLLIAELASRVREQADAALRRERRTHTLYTLTRELAPLRDPQEIAATVARRAAEALGGPATVRLGDTSGPDAATRSLPLRGAQGVLGVLTFQTSDADQQELAEALAHQAAAHLERARLAADAERARVAAESERLRSTLLSSVSHDLRTPLGVILGAASTLAEDDGLGAPARRDLARSIADETRALNRRVANLLDMTRVESGSLQLERDWVSVEEVVGAALERLGRLLDNHTIVTEISPETPLVHVDGALLEQVLVNLLENAVKYTPPGSAVRVAADAAPGGVAIELSDDGPGLPPGSEERVFERFHREHRGQGGFGLGLAISRALVEAHGGRIEAGRAHPHGARFRIVLPSAAPPHAGEAEDADG